MKDRDFLAGLELDGFVAYSNMNLEDAMLYEACVVTHDNGTSIARRKQNYLGYDLRYLNTKIQPHEEIYIRNSAITDAKVQL